MRPALRRMLGDEGPDPQRPGCGPSPGPVDVARGEGAVRPRGVDARRRGPLRRRARLGHGSHLVTALARATCLAVVPVGVTEVAPGDEVECVLLGPLPPEAGLDVPVGHP